MFHLLFHFFGCLCYWINYLMFALPEMFRVILCRRWDSCIKMFDQINHDDGLIRVNLTAVVIITISVNTSNWIKTKYLTTPFTSTIIIGLNHFCQFPISSCEIKVGERSLALFSSLCKTCELHLSPSPAKGFTLHQHQNSKATLDSSLHFVTFFQFNNCEQALWTHNYRRSLGRQIGLVEICMASTRSLQITSLSSAG